MENENKRGMEDPPGGAPSADHGTAPDADSGRSAADEGGVDAPSRRYSPKKRKPARKPARRAAKRKPETVPDETARGIDDLTVEQQERLIEEAIIKGEMAGVEKRRRARRFFFRRRRELTEAERKRFPKRLGRIIDNYVFMEAFSMWLLGFFGFLGFLIVNQLFLEGEKLLNPQIPPSAVIALIFYNIPQHITWSLPIAIVFATLMSMGRLAKDNELTAIFTNGISLYRMFLPFFILAISNCVVLYYVNDFLVAPSVAKQERLKEIYPLLRDIDEEVAKKEPTIVKLPKGAYFEARAFDKFTGEVSTIFYDTLTAELPGGEPRAIWLAPSGSIKGSVLTMVNPKKYIVGDDGMVQSMENPQTADIDLGLQLYQIVSDIRTPEKLTKDELVRRHQMKQAIGSNVDRDLTDLWLKYSSPFAPLAFALVAMPLSLRAPRDERLLGLILTFLLVLAYYVIYFISKIMGYNGVIPPWLAAWLMNIVFAALSFLIFATSRK